MDLLWPQYNLNKSTTQLHTAIYQIRKVMKESGLNIEIKYKEGGYSLVLKEVDIDFQEWESAVREAPPLSVDTLDLHLGIMKTYQGHLLEQSQYSWAILEQERLQRIWLNHVQQIAELYLSLANYSEALVLYQQIVEKLPFTEVGYFGLMQINDILHFPIEVKKQYDLLCERLLEAFDMTPSKKVMLWYEEWSVTSIR
ncbi:Bacterial transcriptional activator domain protein [compost metagenome]